MPRNLKLADPQFNVSSKVDILIGAEIFWDLLCVGQIQATNYHPTLQKTRLGWILAGRIANNRTVQGIHAFHAAVTCTSNQLHEQVPRFWQLEDVATTIIVQSRTLCVRITFWKMYLETPTADTSSSFQLKNQ